MPAPIFDPDDLLEVAEHLLMRDGEASARSAISRAYYCVFLIARDLAGIDDESPSVHAQTLRYFEDNGERDIADSLWELRRTRNRADYKTNLSVSRGQCVSALRKCRQTRAALKQAAGRVRYRARATTVARTS
jgi:uncharacterized protein (UPF0332 family)